jgi:hypothetical protein
MSANNKIIDNCFWIFRIIIINSVTCLKLIIRVCKHENTIIFLRAWYNVYERLASMCVGVDCSWSLKTLVYTWKLVLNLNYFRTITDRYILNSKTRIYAFSVSSVIRVNFVGFEKIVHESNNSSSSSSCSVVYDCNPEGLY